MTAEPSPGHYDFLDFIGPMSDERASRMVASISATKPKTITDFGCGTGELLLRAVAATPTATGCGVDVDKECLARARTMAQERGLADRVRFIEAEAATVDETADVVLSIGASHAFGDTTEALPALRTRVHAGGLLYFGEGFWERPPTDEEVAGLGPGASRDEYGDLAALVDCGIAAGFRPVRIETATRQEWEDFMSGFLLDWEDRVLRHPNADKLRSAADAQRNGWLRGYRDVLGFAYLTFGVPH